LRRKFLVKLKLLKEKRDFSNLYNEILNIVGERLKQVEKQIGQRLRSPYIPIGEMGIYLAASPGKRLRPTLLLLVSNLLNYEGDADIEYAVILEFIHTATLVHDDIVDQAILRRGRASLNSKWGSQLAVLMGDYLYISAVEMAVKREWSEIQRIIAETSKNLIEGELFQSHKNFDLTISEEEYFEIIKLKTAKLFSTCTIIPPILSNRDKKEVDALYNYGLNIGMGFQIVDDCFDFLYDEKTIGKPAGMDLKEGKLTLPLIYLRDYGKISDKEFLEAVVAGRRFDTATLESLSEMVVRGGFVNKAISMATEYVENARKYLEVFPESETKKVLEQIPQMVINRSF
jgi:octaprenyl-diphosphate synthase